MLSRLRHPCVLEVVEALEETRCRLRDFGKRDVLILSLQIIVDLRDRTCFVVPTLRDHS